MTTNVEVSVEALSDLKLASLQFAEQIRAALISADVTIHSTLGWLESRVTHWQVQVRFLEEELSRALAALAACEASGSYDDEGDYQPPDCSYEEAAVSYVQQQLHTARQELDVATHWLQAIQHQAEDYYRLARRMDQAIHNDIQAACAFLDSAIRDLESYLALALAASLGPVVFTNLLRSSYQSARIAVGRAAVERAKQEEMALVRRTGYGSRPWSSRELAMIRRGHFPKGYVGHHINNVARFPHLADNPDNIRFVTRHEHWALHRYDWHHNTCGKMFNRQSLMSQRPRYRKGQVE